MFGMETHRLDRLQVDQLLEVDHQLVQIPIQFLASYCIFSINAKLIKYIEFSYFKFCNDI